MKRVRPTVPPSAPLDTNEEIASLTEVLYETDKRLEELLAGQIDAVADREGRTMLLRHAQEHLRESEAAKQAAILNALPAHIALLDSAGIIVSVNEAWRRFAIGHVLQSPGHGVGLNYVDICDQSRGDETNSAGLAAAGMRAVLGGEMPSYASEYACHSPSEQRWYRMTVTPLQADAAVGAVVMHVDISERRRAEDIQRQTTELLRAVVTGTPDFIFIKDLQSRYLFSNEAAANFVGRTAEQVVGQDSSSLFGADAGLRSIENDRSVIETGLPLTVEEVLGGVGGDRTVLSTKAPYLNERGEVIGVIGISRDISDRKHAEQERDREHQLLRTLIDAQPDAIYTKDAAGRFVICNLATLTTFGFEREQDMAGKTAFDILPAESAERMFLEDLQVLGGQSLFEREECITDGNGAQQWLTRIKVPLRDQAGEIVGVVGIGRNVTARKQAEQELRDSQARYSMACRLARMGAWWIELSPLVVQWSDEVCSIHEVEPGFVPTLEQGIAFYAPEWVDTITRAVQACSEQGTPYDLELEVITARGRRIWVRTMGEAVLDGGGVIRRVQGAFQDLSERKQAEKEIHRLAARLTNTLESITEGFYTVDREWRFTYVNAEAERMLGRRREDLIGRVLAQEFPLSVGTEFERELERAAREDRAHTFESYFEPWETWFRVNVYPSDEGLAVYFKNVSAERAARQQLELLEASVSQLNDMVVITEASPLQAPGPRIVFVNEAFVRFTGHARAEVLGLSPRLLQGPLTDRAELDRVRDALGHFEHVHTELLNYKKDGEPCWLEIDIVPFGVKDGVEGGVEGEGYSHFVAVARDVTERRRDQTALRELNAELEGRVSSRTAELLLARDDAEQANRAKSGFLAAMSHEIRTPMNGVIGMVEVLHQTSLKGYQVEMVDLIRDSAFSLLKIIEDILDFSKIEAGKLSVDNEPMCLPRMVEKVCAMLDHLAVKLGVRMTMFVDPALPASVLGDESRLRQVLVNLVSNAIKFSGGRAQPGRVSVRVLMVERDAQAVTVDLVVIDNGIGMDAAALSHLFMPFSQADASTTRRFGGTGLGLAISSMLVRLMEGAISVHSVPDEGSTFSVRVRFAGATDSDCDEALPAVQGLQCRIVGSEQALAEDLGRYLVHAGVRVEHAPDLASAAGAEQGSDPWLWLILPGETPPTPDLLRALAPGAPAEPTRFMQLGWGKRRRPRLEAADLAVVDADTLCRATLLKMLGLASGRLLDGSDHDDPEPTAPSRAPRRLDARLQGRLILVAEDNETNRVVIGRQLKLIGYAADVVVNGREALEQWRSGDFALLLTDLHMPHMDGYALSRAIRAEETEGRHMPIIALTANALRDEELRCREAGMDAYLSKPVRLAQLKAAIENWLGPTAQAPVLRDDEQASQAGTPPANLNVLAALVGDDPAVLDEVLQAFRKSAQQSSAELEEGAHAGSMPTVANAAHKLKSGARAIGAMRLGELCAEIEQAAQSLRGEELNKLLLQFRAELVAVHQFLDAR